VVRRREADAVYLSAAGLSVDDLLQDIFHVFYDTERYRPEPARLRRLLGSVSAVVVIDDFEGTADELRRLLDTVAACDVLVSVRSQRLFGLGRTLRLAGVDQEASREMLIRHLGRRVTSEEETAVGRLWSMCRGNPQVLVRTAVAVGIAEADRAGGLPRLTLDAAEPALVPVLAARLGGQARQMLSVLSAFGEAAVSDAALSFGMSGSPYAIERHRQIWDELIRAGLVVDVGRGCLRVTSLGAAIASALGPPLARTPLAERLTRWVDSASAEAVADTAPGLIHVVEQVTAEAAAVAVALARATSPKLALALHMDAWDRMLDRGLHAARVAGSVEDERYFTGEHDVLRVLGIAAISSAVAVGVTVAATAGHAGGAGVAVVKASPLHVVATHPAIVVAAAAALATSGVLGWQATGDSAASVAATPPVTSAPVDPPTAGPTTTPRRTPPAPTKTPRSATTQPPGIDSSDCDPGPNDWEFSQQTRTLRLTLGSCTYDSSKLQISGPDRLAFRVTRVSCPGIPVDGDTCQLDIDFVARQSRADAYIATLDLPTVAGSIGISDQLTGDLPVETIPSTTTSSDPPIPTATTTPLPTRTTTKSPVAPTSPAATITRSERQEDQ